MNTDLQIGDKHFTLRRYPLQKNETLQAWDAADEYLIEQVSESALPKGKHIAIFNDGFGALTCWCKENGYRVSHVSDSVLSQISCRENLKVNSHDTSETSDVGFLSSLSSLPDDIDLVLMKLPKYSRFLVWQLQQLAFINRQRFAVIAGAKAKDIHTSTLKLFEKHLGPTMTSLAKKKARLIFCQPKETSAELPGATTQFSVDDFQLTLHNHANVFSSESLDIAAYLMLKHIPENIGEGHIIDLGCGNGVLAVQAALLNPNASITAVDESHMAVASADLNLRSHGIETTRFKCVANNCLDGFHNDSADLILCNPPFHQLNAVTDHIAWQMFCDARRVLSQKGRLLVIGNRHLGYHAKLKRLFGNASVVASNKKFVIVEAYVK
ncbi:50S rRNA methyltransferase [Veronia nyctiphanis]|uniref:Ribosomal RNA large subunit methyltransferase G n=1 Tax=Veronia nyctiphanis TaxID=1278244 RepID=A0A4Q0YQU0_9GAMM|nr:methyltransferase [Veronia nyctiphanis]RXJ72955.1 50S rRNA methyltransferase [Veronia nyctiphanis]